MWLFRFLITLTISLFFIGCSSSPSDKTYRIGIDSSFFPLNLGEKEMYVNAFTSDLLEEISKNRELNFTLATRNWDDLIFDLKRGQYEAILSAMKPTLPNQGQFNFSELYLETGPVLVMQKGAPHPSLDQLPNNSYIGVMANTRAAIFAETKPNIIPKYYDSERDLCEATRIGEVNGALIEGILAMSFVRNLFEGSLVIVSPPFFDEGIRLITLKEQNEELLAEFNKGLQEIKKKGIYDKLLAKWKLK